ncbi:hypothetical protein GCM10011351_12160 [Paraliobacillus quinghaiensis]|uniref:Gram-positive cocci surface proteins LPxTG domain-containing protein n=1 Tax=Paraliobacillus quinghaiensis TaxID=470815 RepID=A0A917WTG9_9BACI|nr:LPXTG cell wall anchor domain-containing protein [Paraliobacillus quinghaiensis]GGM27829.1 hypothetical protein GCM10011351_12160 [Paraliobacillus quinghaiensis]
MIRIKGLVSILLGLSLLLVFTSQTAANEGDILQKQGEIDQFLFEENNVDLEERGIFVTHTRPFEDTIEVGISPYTEDHAAYLYAELGKDNITVVNGEHAETFTSGQADSDVVTTDVAEESSNPSYLWLYILVGVIIIGGGLFLLKKKK